MAQNEELIIDISNSGAGLPDVTDADDGKVLAVVDGEWDKATIPSGNLPPVTSADNGKVLRVVSGAWSGDNLDDITGNAKIYPLMTRYKGFITSGNKWNYTEESSFLYILIPISGGETLSLVGSSSRAVYYAALKTYSTPADNTYPDFSGEFGWTGRKQVNAGTSTTVTLPSDGRYLYICILDNNRAADPQKIVVGNYDYTASAVGDAILAYINAQDGVVVQDSKVRELDLFSEDGVDAPIIWEVGTVNTSQGTGHPATDYATNTRQRGKGVYQFNEPMDVAVDPAYYYQVFLLDSSYNFVETAFATFTSMPYTIPAKTPFRIAVGKRDNSDVSSVDITQYISVKFNKIKDVLYHDNGVRWCAMGDSITEGYYSYLNDQDEPTNAKSSEKAWATKVAAINKWSLTNLGDGGTGWLDEDEQNDCAYKLARATDYSTYNLLTLAYGINDWKANLPFGDYDLITSNSDTTQWNTAKSYRYIGATTGSLTHNHIYEYDTNAWTDSGDAYAEIAEDVSSVVTPTNVLQAMKISIEAILASNPKCKVIGILPLNCAGYNFAYGNKASNYGLNYSFTASGTLELFYEDLKAVYEYYGIQVIDMTHASVVNRENLESLLIDGVHPSEDCHTLMAYELSKKITF